jgi:hypothetical protein
MRRIQIILAMAAAMVALLAFAALPASAQVFFGDGSLDSDGIFGDGTVFFIGDRDRDGFRFFEEPFDVGSAGPASQEFSIRRLTSGAAAPVVRESNTGSNVNFCPTTQQVVNTGNVANEQGVIQSGSRADDISFSGSEINIAPTVSSSCDQTINQAAAL